MRTEKPGRGGVREKIDHLKFMRVCGIDTGIDTVSIKYGDYLNFSVGEKPPL